MAVTRQRRIRAVKPNPGIRASYRKAMASMIRQMHEDYLREIDALYSALEPRITGDATWRSPMERLDDLLTKLSDRWTKRFAVLASSLVPRTVKSIFSRVKDTRRQTLKDMGFNIKISKSRVMDDRVQALILASASDVQSIPATYAGRVAKAVSNSVVAGLDREALTQELHKGLGIELRKARHISRDQTNKATQAMAESTDESLGVTEGIWVHVPGRKMSRATHVAMNGKKFKLNEGLYDPDRKVRRNVKPGSLPLCACIYRPVWPESWGVKLK